MFIFQKLCIISERTNIRRRSRRISLLREENNNTEANTGKKYVIKTPGSYCSCLISEARNDMIKIFCLTFPNKKIFE